MQRKIFREYSSINQPQNHWGIQLKNAGYTQVLSGESYPGQEHPNEYYFSWQRGRILQEYQLILITQGKGEFESATAKRWKIKPGSVILLFKNEWHRYRPDKATGWQEYWVGFDGDLAEYIFQNSMFKISQPVLYIGNNEMITNLMIKIFSLLEAQQQGNEKIVASYVPVMLAMLETLILPKPGKLAQAENMVKKCQIKILENFDKPIDIKELACEMQVSYSWLRRRFKQYIGLAPNQYLLKLRLQKARDLLVLTSKPVKTISLECGFLSPYYFSRYFKEDGGISPSQYREKVKN